MFWPALDLARQILAPNQSDSLFQLQLCRHEARGPEFKSHPLHMRVYHAKKSLVPKFEIFF